MTRQERYRRRLRDGIAVYRIAASQDLVLNALIDSGWLTEEESLDCKCVEEALREVVADWARQWRRR